MGAADRREFFSRVANEIPVSVVAESMKDAHPRQAITAHLDEGTTAVLHAELSDMLGHERQAVSGELLSTKRTYRVFVDENPKEHEIELDELPTQGSFVCWAANTSAMTSYYRVRSVAQVVGGTPFLVLTPCGRDAVLGI
jgi:hypothetical protein